MFTLKQAVEIGIEMGMTEFAIQHHAYKGTPIIQTADTVLDFIKEYENEIPVIIYYGSNYYSRGLYYKPYHCFISYRLVNEKLPTP